MKTCMNGKCPVLRAEFRWQKFKLKNTSRENFTKSSVIKDQRWFIVFKLFLFVYEIIWWIFSLMAAEFPLYLFYFTSFQDIWLIVYLFTSLLIVIEDKCNKHDPDDPKRDVPLWYHKASWIIHTITMMSTILTFIMFWLLIAPSMSSDELKDPLNMHHHFGVTLIAFIDMLFSDIPVRIVHCVYGTLYGYAYFFYNISLHLAGVVSDIYPFTSWKKSPIYSGIVTSLLMTIMPLVIQTASFGVFKLRVFVRCKFMNIHEQQHHHRTTSSFGNVVTPQDNTNAEEIDDDRPTGAGDV